MHCNSNYRIFFGLWTNQIAGITCTNTRVFELWCMHSIARIYCNCFTKVLRRKFKSFWWYSYLYICHAFQIFFNIKKLVTENSDIKNFMKTFRKISCKIVKNQVKYKDFSNIEFKYLYSVDLCYLYSKQWAYFLKIRKKIKPKLLIII